MLCSACADEKNIFCHTEHRPFQTTFNVRRKLAIFLQNTTVRNNDVLEVKYTTQSGRLAVFILAGFVIRSFEIFEIVLFLYKTHIFA